MITNGRIPYRLLLWIVVVWLAGCQPDNHLSTTPVPATDTARPAMTSARPGLSASSPTVADTEMPAPTATPVATGARLTVTPTATIRPTETVTPTAEVTLTPPVIIIEYTNDEYGFSLRYPSNWLLVELPHRILLASGSVGALQIQFKRVGEEVVITRTGVPAGDLVADGFVDFLGEMVARDVLVYQGRDKAVLYERAAEIERGELVFTIWLQSNRPDYESIDIPGNVQQVADQIVESFRASNEHGVNQP